MHRRTRLYLMLTRMEKTVAEQLAEPKDELSPSTLSRWPLRDAAPQGGI
jgi:hypothetical protein